MKFEIHGRQMSSYLVGCLIRGLARPVAGEDVVWARARRGIRGGALGGCGRGRVCRRAERPRSEASAAVRPLAG